MLSWGFIWRGLRRLVLAGIASMLICGVTWPSPADIAPGALEESLGLLDRFEAERALAVVDRALAEHPDSSALEEAKGFALFSLGRYAEAVEWLDRAATGPNPDASLMELAGLARRTREVVASFVAHASEHFEVSLDEKADGVLAPYVLDALERAREEIGRDIGYYPPDVLRVEIYPTAETFSEASGLSLRDIEVSGAVGLCRYNKIMTLSPRALVKGYRWLDTLSHEYVHFILTRRTHGNLPIWLHEGIARYEEARWRMAQQDVLDPVSESLLGGAVRTGELLSFADMEPSLVALETSHDVHLAYAECVAAVRWIVEHHGLKGIRRILDVLEASDGATVEEAISSAVGLSLQEFEGAWQAALSKSNLRELDGVEPSGYVLADGRRGADELEDIKSLAASQLTGLADRLREKGRLVPAVAEYERALRKSPYEVVILTKLGIALVESGRLDEARERFEAVLARAPDAVSAHKYLGLLALAEGRYEEARARTEEAVGINPFDPQLHHTLGQVYSRLGQTELAEREGLAYRRLTGASSGLE